MPARPDGEAVALDARDASITTATVTIKALQVSKKQMTQSVFRQLPVGTLVDEDDVKLDGEPWGWVNYRVGDQDQGERNFVAQLQGRLYRCPLELLRSRDFARYRLDRLPYGYRSIFSNAVELEKYRLYIRLIGGGEICVAYSTGGMFDIPMSFGAWGRKGSIPRTERLQGLWLSEGGGKLSGKYARPERFAPFIEEMEEHFGIVPKIDDLDALIIMSAAHGDDYCRRWDALMGRLEAVEQLYIAC